MKKTLMLLTSAIAVVVQAETFVWTGVQDAYWTNKANWMVSGAVPDRCPGSILTDDKAAQWAALEAENDTVIFDGTGVNPAVGYIDLDGQLAVSSVIFRGADAPAYVLGKTATTERLGIRYGATTVDTPGVAFESTLGAKPVFTNGLRLFEGFPGGGSYYAVVENNSVYEFDLGSWGGMTCSAAGNPSLSLTACGTGSFAFGATDAQSYTVNWYLDLCQKGGVRVYGGMGEFAAINFKPPADATMQVELESTGSVNMQPRTWTVINATGNVRIFGEGSFVLHGRKGFMSPDISISTGKTLEFACKTLTVKGDDGTDWWLDTNIGGTLRLSSPLAASFMSTYGSRPATSGNVQLRGGSGTIESYAVGVPTETPFGTSSCIYFGNGNTFAYVGPGEDAGRVFVLTNFSASAGNATATLAQRGTGDWTVAGVTDLSWTGKANTLTLENDTEFAATVAAPLVEGEGTLAVTKTGAGLWILSCANAYTGATTLEGGTLALDATQTIASLVVNGDVAIAIADGVTVTVSAFSRTVGKLDVQTTGTGKLMLPSSEFGVTESWFTLNGEAAQVQVDGTVSVADHVWASTLDIPAHGGVIPTTATANDVVGITTDGAGSDPITVAAEEGCAIKGLVQKTAADATVVLASGQTLNTGLLAVEPTAGSFTITADEPGGGLFVLPGKKLSVDVGNADATLAVETPIDMDGKTFVKTGDGTAVISAASVFSARATVDGGVLAYVIDDATLVKSAKSAEAEITAYDMENSASKVSVSVTGDGLVLGGTSTTAHPLSVSVPGGSSLQVTGTDTVFNVSGFSVGSATGAEDLSAKLRVEGGAELVYDVNGLLVGGEMTVSNATVRLGTSGTAGDAYNALILGRNLGSGLRQSAKLVVDKDGEVRDTRVVVGYSYPASLIVNGGTLNASYYGGRSTMIGCGLDGYNDGYVKVIGGSFTFGIYTSAVLGNMEVAADAELGNAFGVAGLPYGNFHLRMTGGTVLATGTTILCCGAGDGVITVEGPTTVFRNTSTPMMKNNPDAGRTSIINVNNGGTWDKHGIAKESAAAGKVFVNVNGGTFTPRQKTSLIDPSVDRVTVYEDGVRVLMNNYVSYLPNTPQGKSFLAAPGKGIGAVIGFVPLKDRVTPPCVIVEGDGEGASAAPIFDEKTGTLMGIKVTSPGWNYTWAKIHLVTHAYSAVTNATYACELVQNRRGGLTLETTQNYQSFDLNKSNELAFVRIKGGSLQTTADGAIPMDAELIMEGGDLDLKANEARFGSFSATGGRVTSTAAESAKAITISVDRLVGPIVGVNGDRGHPTLSVAVSGGLDLDGEKIAASDWTPWAIARNVTFASEGVGMLKNADKLDSNVKYIIMTIENGTTVTGLPKVVADDGSSWRLKRVGNSIRLYRTKGMVIIVQ